MTWHLWRIATLRPEFGQIGAKAFTFSSFLLMFALGVWLRWGVVVQRDWPAVISTIASNLVFFWFAIRFWCGDHKPWMPLLCSVLGLSFLVDLVASGAALLLQAQDIAENLGFMYLEFALYAVMLFRFEKHSSKRD